jgi:hypothetical protein
MSARPPWIRSLGPLALTDLRHRYAGSVLGGFWAIAAPLLEGTRCTCSPAAGPRLRETPSFIPPWTSTCRRCRPPTSGPGIALGGGLAAGLRHHVFSARNLRATRLA